MATVSTTTFLKTMLKHTKDGEYLVITISSTVDALRAKRGYLDGHTQGSIDAGKARLELAGALLGIRAALYEPMGAAQLRDIILLALAPQTSLLHAATDRIKGCGWSLEYDGGCWQGGPAYPVRS